MKNCRTKKYIHISYRTKKKLFLCHMMSAMEFLLKGEELRCNTREACKPSAKPKNYFLLLKNTRIMSKNKAKIHVLVILLTVITLTTYVSFSCNV
ncbi:hypothetical protein ANTPLA_LOCUS6916 [Anthophora plagiata]